MSKDLIGQLKDDWWQNAKEASKWKPKFECMKEIFNILTGNEETNVEITCNISDHKKGADLLKILTDWLVNENHIFTRIAILRLMPKLIESLPKKTVSKYQTQMIESIMTKQWTEKKAALLSLVTPTLISLWLKTGFELKSDEVKPHLIAALKHRGKESRMSAADFIGKCTMYSKRKKQVQALCEDRDIGGILSKLAQSDKDKTVKLSGCFAFHGLNEMGVLKGKKVNKELPAALEALQANKFGKKNLEAAAKTYSNEKSKVSSGGGGGGDDEEEKKEDKKEEKKKGKKGKKGKKKKGGGGGGGGGDAPKSAPAQPSGDGGGGDLADDEKMEDGKKYKKVIKKVTKQRPKPGSGKEYKKGIGGKLEPNGVEKTKNKCKKPKKVEENKPIDPKSLEDAKKALDAASKFKAANTQTTFKKLENWVKNDQDSLKKTAKITERVKSLEPIAKELKGIASSKWNNIYDAIIGLGSECMGWEGNDARNPTLAKLMLDLIGTAMANCDVDKKQTGIFSIYLSWAMQRLAESKFNKLATECLLNTCYQFSPKVVFSKIEKVLFEPEDEKKDPFKNDKAWGPVIQFISDAIKQFGVDNFYVNRLIHIIHTKMPKARDKKAKEACYSALTTLYQQLGSDWSEVLLSAVSKQGKKSLNKKWEKIKNAGTYTQLRCTKKEAVPKASGQEMEDYEEEVIEWIEVALPGQKVVETSEKKEEKKEEEVVVKKEEKEKEEAKEPTPEPEPEPTPPPPDGPLQSTSEHKKKRLGKCKKLIKLWEQSKPLDKGIIKEYDGQINPKKISKNQPGIFNESPGSEYKCGDMDKWKKEFIDRKSTVKKWKPIVASLCSWISAFEGTKFWNTVNNTIDIMLYWSNAVYTDNPQPNVGKMMIDLWKQICESLATSFCQLGEVEGKMLLPIICDKALGTKQTKDMAFELCEAIEHVYPPAICYKIYLSTLEKTKSNSVGLACMQRLAKAITDYGLIKCDLKKFKLKCKPYSSPKDFVKQFIKFYLKCKDKKTIEAAAPILMYCYEVVGDKGFWKECKVKGSQKDDIEKIVEDAETFKKGKYRKPEKEWIGDLIKKEKKRLAKLAAMKEAGNGGINGGENGNMGGMGGIDGGIPIPPLGPLPGLEAAGFTPLHFTPQQLLALKYGPAPHSWKMNNFSSYVSRLPPAFCMDWEEFEQKKTTISTKSSTPYIKIGDVRIDVETGRQYQDLTTNDGDIKVYASMPPNNGMGVGSTGLILPSRTENKEDEEKDFLKQTHKDDEIMKDILGVEKDNAEYFDTNNDGSSWLALYDVNGFDETDRQIQLIEMRNIYGVKTLQTWLHTGKNVSIVESSVNKLLSVLLPWLKDLINTETLLSDNQRYEQTYQILQLLKFCSKFKTLKGLNKSELILFFKVLLSSITYDNINALFGHNYKRILGEINDVLIKSILNTPSTDTLCVLISLLKECDPTNDSQSVKQYADACCKLIYKVIKKYDRIICQNSDRVQSVYIEIVKFFSTISFETWQMAEPQRRFPLKVMQMVIARLVWYCGNNSASHLNAAIEKINNKPNDNDLNNAASHQRDTYAKRLILNFIQACETRRLATKPNNNNNNNNKREQLNIPKYDQDDEDEKRKPHNIKQAQSSTNNYMQPSSAQYTAKSTLQNVHDADKEAAQYARDNKIDLNFALWVGMTGRNKQDYAPQY